jgi:hypothetical protein
VEPHTRAAKQPALAIVKHNKKIIIDGCLAVGSPVREAFPLITYQQLGGLRHMSFYENDQRPIFSFLALRELLLNFLIV